MGDPVSEPAMLVLAQAVAPVSVIASAAKQSRNASAEAVWIASARAKALADKSRSSQ